MTKARVLALLVGVVLLLTLPAVASAQSVPPHVFIGDAIVNGIAAPAGTVVIANIGGQETGRAEVKAGGRYGPMLVGPGSGNDITFTIGTLTADQTATWKQGDAEQLDLTASSFGSGGSTGPQSTAVPGGVGPAGADGAAGPRGPQGGKGDPGSSGADGKAGSAGSAGDAGSAGSDGAKGDTGSAGPAGPSGGGPLPIIALIVAVLALLAAGGAFAAGRKPA